MQIHNEEIPCSCGICLPRKNNRYQLFRRYHLRSGILLSTLYTEVPSEPTVSIHHIIDVPSADCMQLYEQKANLRPLLIFTNLLQMGNSFAKNKKQGEKKHQNTANFRLFRQSKKQLRRDRKLTNEISSQVHTHLYMLPYTIDYLAEK